MTPPSGGGATPSLDGRRFAAGDLVWSFREDREGLLSGTYAGGAVAAGSFVGRRDGRDLTLAWSQLGRNGFTRAGSLEVRVEVLESGLVRVPWVDSVLEELPGPRWVRTRVAHPTASLDACVAFYGGLLGLEVDGPHVATPYDIVFVALPGGAQLELTAGGPAPVPGTADDLLVLYVPSAQDVAGLRTRLVEAGVEGVPALNPYWERMGLTVLDPDGRRVVVAQLPG